MRRLSIVHTESSLGWGGQEIRILSEAQGLIGRGHDVKLLCPAEARIYSEAPAWGVPVVALPIAKKGIRGLRGLLEWFKTNRCDVVSTHSSTDSWLAALTLLILGRPYPIVRTRHISAPVPKNAPTRWLYTRATSRIVTAGEALKKELVERNGFPAERIDSVPTGVDAKRFRPGDKAAAREALGLPHDRMLVGIVATLRSWKGHRYLVEAFASLPDSAGLVMVGDGPQRKALEAVVDKLGLRSRTTFAGNQRDVVPWLQALDAFALPSYANEGVPQALLQAMLVGLPCVTTAAGSIPELAIDGQTALVVPPEQVLPLRQALERLLGDPELRKTLGSAARKHCEEAFSYERMLERMEQLYRSVAGVPPRLAG
ncbi:MAG: glycosyl transferase family 1 [Betaproteobacteria bacterium RIFCSPLOWO2_12_FULL_65_14]|nr:MAG: glycosyl transferase family 1 [Betaproteobacteria bacterium RIFCSPLOWO2_12_FULL_65_14]